MTGPAPKIEDVNQFWQDNPVCAKDNPFPLGTPDYFRYFDRLRADLEPPEFADAYYEFSRFSGKKVLDVGCGNGWVLSRYASAGADVYGVDLTQAGVELCKKRFELSGLKGDFRVGNAEALPFEGDQFDAVTCMGVLHHTPHPERGFAEIARVLKPGGRFFTMVYHRDSVLYRVKFPLLRRLTGRSLQQLINEVDGVENPKGDVYTKQELETFLSSFENVTVFSKVIQGWMVLPKIGRFIPNRFLKPLENRWGWFLYGKAQKRLPPS